MYTDDYGRWREYNNKKPQFKMSCRTWPAGFPTRQMQQNELL